MGENNMRWFCARRVRALQFLSLSLSLSLENARLFTKVSLPYNFRGCHLSGLNAAVLLRRTSLAREALGNSLLSSFVCPAIFSFFNYGELHEHLLICGRAHGTELLGQERFIVSVHL